jgi:glycine betaine/proline transport system permease protein
MFLDFGSPLRHATNTALDWLVTTHGDAFEALSNGLLAVLLIFEQVLRGAHPALLIGFVSLIAYAASRRLTQSAAMGGLLYLVGCLGLWDQAMQTVAIMLVSVSLAVVIGLPIGVLAARSPAVRAVLSPLLDLMQTIPSFVYLIPAAMLLGLGKVPAVLATVIYATPPLIRLTDLGLRQVEPQVVEAARVFGATRRRLLLEVELPLALPSIMQGLNQTVMMALGMVVIASMIGARGVGETVLVGLQRNDSGAGLVGGLGIVLLAVLFDRTLQSFGERRQASRPARAVMLPRATVQPAR